MEVYIDNPVVDVTSTNIRCNVGGNTLFAPATMSVAAGSNVGFTADPPIYHPGPLQVYMAKAPSGKTAANWDGSGSVWFKINELGPKFGGQALTWPTDSMRLISFSASEIANTKADAASVNFTIPKATPSGDYLLRVEHIALHTAQSAGAAQFYISCAQITVTNGGAGTPGPLVAFPGAYKATDPGLMINIYYPVVSTVSCE